MCRWFSYISDTESALLEDILITPEHSISKQVNSRYLPGLLPYVAGDNQVIKNDPEALKELGVNFLYNVDGIGTAWYSLQALCYIQALICFLTGSTRLAPTSG